ncbi:MAG: tRNA (N6-isopentenyl adenosine(37)-C2)-methylthiotransferase MiaB, partial [Thermodesulfobacteriota bacterium]
MKKKYLYLETYGCQMNEYDSDRIHNALNVELTGNPKEADYIIVNTCAIREKADQKALSSMGRYKHLKSANPELIIGMAGCVAQLYGKKLLKQMPYLDFVLGPRAIPNLPQIISEIETENTRKIDISFDIEEVFEVSPFHEAGRVSAFVSIQQGCNKRCAYCIVPTVRGSEVNRPVEDIVKEAVYLLSKGVREITLIGQTVNSWKHDKYKFADLLRIIGELEGLDRLRFTTSYPRDITKRMVEAMMDVKEVCNHIHLPVQSGSDNVLKLMNRTYSRQWYLDSVNRLRDAIPDIAISTDMIIGFPGETDSDFEQTVSLLDEVEFESSFSFKYSTRPGTEGEKLAKTGSIDDKICSERLSTFQEKQKYITLNKNLERIGKTEEVLVEGFSKHDNNFLFGRTTHNRIMNFEGGGKLVGNMVDVRVEEGLPNSLRGVI